MQGLSLSAASQIADTALARARAIGCKPLTVALLDPGGHLIVLKREDHSGILRPQIAYAKAWGVLGMGHGGRLLAERAAAAPAFFTALSDISDGRIAPVPGGVLIRGGHDNLLGAIGISGDTSDVDERCAVFAIESVGLKAICD
ncbi:heme-binding protein [Burkholderia pseudomultivorans]|uniref:GlcG/HbpS family heme-binding protein n=1 Tax=Burkholderia pseudomultivorans TaxID=1207504 RepID=UPI002874E3FA|nr:heme-binding protein [Burkholderia pseudomultivorans]MDS0858646.1 heme-binding protein [Burkholderia pseudomultivorans]